MCDLALGRFPLLLVQLTASTTLKSLGLCLYKVVCLEIYGKAAILLEGKEL